MKHFKTAALAATIAMSGVAAHAQDEGGSYVLTTASTGGTYYPVGVALATLVKVKLEPKAKIGMSAISSAGSGENVRLLREDEAQFGILQGLFGYYAATGTGPIAEVGPQENLRSVSMLWQNVEHFLVSSDVATTGSLADMVALKGEAMGPKPPKLKGNSGPYTRQQIEKAAKEAKVDIGAKSRMMMKLRDM
ncbi:MAG: TAXI family TRAP transporter solute-binding subunit [Marivita sp.]